jgi:hypothetical protein
MELLGSIDYLLYIFRTANAMQKKCYLNTL